MPPTTDPLAVPACISAPDYLRDIHEEVLYALNPGNAGDSLITHATYQVFDRIGLRFEPLELKCDSIPTEGRIVIYAGGANLVPLYRQAREFLARHHRKVKRLIVLPHTIRGNEDLLSDFGDNVEIVCRDGDSFQHVRRHAAHAKVYFAHDMAFDLDVAATFARGKSTLLPAISGADLAVRNVKRRMRTTLHALRNLGHREVLYAFRNDCERTNIVRPFSNIDVSQVFATEDMQPRRSLDAAYRMLQFLNRFSVIHTNRLHVCIAAALLDRTVHFYPNSYKKNEAVYTSSIEGRFPNVTWHG